MNPEQHEMLVRIDERTDKLLKTNQDHEIRLRSLERFRNWAFGAVAAVSTFVGYLFRPTQ